MIKINARYGGCGASAILVLAVGIIALLGAAAAAASSSSTEGAGKSSEVEVKLRYFLFTEQCFDTFFVDFELLNVPCLKKFISRGLSYGIIAGSTALKLPFLYNIVVYGTAGLSATSLYLDVASCMPVPIYNFLEQNPFFTYGETVIVLVQNIVLVFVYWMLVPAEQASSLARKALVILLLMTFGAGISQVPEELRPMLPFLGASFVIFSRVPQIIKNHEQKHTGSLSAITYLLQFVGSLARIFTTMQETKNPLFQVGSISIACLLSAIVLVQMAIYRKKTAEVTAMKKEHDD